LCKVLGEVRYLFHEKSLVQEKVALFMGDGPIIFQKATFEISATFLVS
jgi:hypothetical protein